MDLIAVHAGAGYQNDSNRENYKQLCAKACEAGVKALKEGKDILEAVVESVKVLEDSELTNAGRGSNVCMDGSIECDASVMTSEGEWAAVGALSNIKNPIEAAHELLKHQRVPRPCGLVPPCILVGSGAKDWTQENHVSSITDLETERSLRVHRTYKRRLEEAKQTQPTTIKATRLDTVGAVGITRTGRTASAVSSGGIALKSRGRIGQASMFGAGCWSDDSVAVTTSGVGEYLIKTLLAKELAGNLIRSLQADELPVQALRASFQYNFLDSKLLRNVESVDKISGALVVLKDQESSSLEILSVHNTPTMCIGFMSTNQQQAQTIFSKSPAALGQEPEIVVNATCVTLDD